jgi:hypothetical protein
MLAMSIATIQAAAEDTLTFEKDIRPLVENYCFDCHDKDALKGDLDLTRFETTAQIFDSIAVWQRIRMRVENGEMPPRKTKNRPTDEEKAKILKWVDSLKPDNTDCDKIANEESVSWYPGYVMSRRLNRAEYENSVRDLFGVEVAVADLFPADGAGGEGFDNNGNALFLSAIQVEKYLEAADLVVEAVFPQKKFGPLTTVAKLLSPGKDDAPPSDERVKEIEAARARLITAKPGKGVSAHDAATKVLSTFLENAWRRPVAEDEVERIAQVFDRAYKRGDGYEAALKLAFKASLVSSNFLFLSEPQPEEQGVYELGGYQIASRLSYFLWSSMPDKELFALAESGMLNDTEQLRQQVYRMLRDPKAKALGEQFATQWLGVSQLGEGKRPDATRFPEFDNDLAVAMQDETAMYFNRIVSEDRSLLELIDSDYTIANERLAKIYGVDGVTGDEMRVVQFADRNRGGVLGMAAVLTATSQTLRTSPVLRGKWVLEQVLGEHVPPPLPTAGTLPEDDHQPDGLSFRARLEMHRKNPECASCHDRMDPLGFGLENFDPIGRWRTEQAGQPIDSQGTLPSGEKFTGPQELKQILLKRKEGIARNLSRKMLGYALGRALTRYDDCVVDKCVNALAANDYKPSNMFIEIVLSHPFRHRYSGSGT